MQNNPFKFGSIVDDPYFINRNKEITRVKSVLNSSNHLILISPRRFGKSSLIYKVVGEINRPVIALDLQLITSVEDFAAQLLKRVYRLFPFEKVRQFVRKFRIIPTISINPVTNEVDISFHPESSNLPRLENILNLIEKLSAKRKKIIVVFDEFQEVHHIGKELPRQLADQAFV
jgi:AAA+ ATPase superfamily predicted ATPase